MSKRRNWIWIVFGVFVVLFMLGIGAMIATTAWIQSNLTVTETTEGTAQQELDTIRARFANRPPLLEMRDGRPAYSGGRKPDAPAAPEPVSNLHVMVWDPDENRLLSVAVPFWLLRLKSGPIEFSSYASGWDDEGVDLTPEDLEKHGPGLILDMTGRRGERVLLWTQ
jgi:hypothetical protein